MPSSATKPPSPVPPWLLIAQALQRARQELLGASDECARVGLDVPELGTLVEATAALERDFHALEGRERRGEKERRP